MHPVQEFINTRGIDCSIQRLTEYINEYESNNFPTQNVTIELRQHKSTPAHQIPRHWGPLQGEGEVLNTNKIRRPCWALTV